MRQLGNMTMKRADTMLKVSMVILQPPTSLKALGDLANQFFVGHIGLFVFIESSIIGSVTAISMLQISDSHLLVTLVTVRCCMCMAATLLKPLLGWRNT